MEMVENGRVENHLTTEYSLAKKRTKQKAMASKRLLVCLIVACILFLIALIVIAVALRPRPEDPSANVQNNGLLCSLNETITLETSKQFHNPCSSAVSVVESCGQSENPAWRTFSPQSPAWGSAVKLVTGNSSSYTSIVVSPEFIPRKGICSFHFSFNFRSNSPMHVFVVRSSGVTKMTSLDASQSCAFQFVPSSTSVRLVISSETRIVTENASASVTSTACAKFENLRQFVDAMAPKKARLTRGQRSLCSLEIVNQTSLQCDWLRFRDSTTSVFEHVDSHSCVESGLRQKETHTWFLALTANQRSSSSRAILISPIIEGGSSHVLFSFWYMIKCMGPYVRVYLVPHQDSGPNSAPNMGQKVAEIMDPSQSNGWQYQSYKIAIPASYRYFRIVVEGVVPNNGSCSNHLCYLLQGNLKSPKSPLLVLDDLMIELLNEQCTQSASPAVLDCKFETSDNKSTYCNWTPHCAITNCEIFGMQPWKFHEGDFYNATGKRLHLSVTDNSITHFRSPLVIANSNCSCDLSFSYYIKGLLIPRLEINLVIGSDIKDSQRPLVKQWWFHGLQTNKWVKSSIVLNLDTAKPFQVELRAGYPGTLTPGSAVYVDDFEFKNCDFRHH